MQGLAFLCLFFRVFYVYALDAPSFSLCCVSCYRMLESSFQLVSSIIAMLLQGKFNCQGFRHITSVSDILNKSGR